MKLQAVELALRVLDRGEGRVLGLGDGAETLRQLGELVAVAVPDVEVLAETVEERSRLGRCAAVPRRIRGGR